MDLPGGKTYSIAYGSIRWDMSFGNPWGGIVYRDFSRVSTVVDTILLTSEQDKEVLAILRRLVGKKGYYDAGHWNCRSFAEQLFRHFRGKYEPPLEQ